MAAISEAVLINPPVKIIKGTHAPFVDMKQIEPGNKFVKAAEAREYVNSGSKFQNGDTLMARITPCLENGKISQYKSNDGLPANGSTEFIVFRGKPQVTDNEFVYYLVTSPEFKSFAIGQMTGTSGRQRVPTDCFSKLDINLPSFNDQKAIAAVLGALDDKIELNRQMNATLEDMAKALFKSWFVDFDPVRAKMAGKQPFGMDEAAAALFPDHFSPSELGDIPEFWEIGRVSEVLELKYGKALKSEERKIGQCPVYGSGGVTGFHNVHLVQGPGIIVGRKGTVGSIYWEDSDFYPIDTVFYVAPKSYFTMVYVSSQLKCLGLNNMNTDAAVPGLNRDNVYRLKIVLPPREIIEAYSSVVTPLKAKAALIKKESVVLSNIRDCIMPKLISGQISALLIDDISL